MQEPAQTTSEVVYRETVWPSALATLPLLLTLPLVTVILLPITDLVIASLAASAAFVAIVVSVAATSPTVAVTSNGGAKTLHVKRASIEEKYIGQMIEVLEQQSRAERGPNLDARAFICFQPSVKTMIKMSQIDGTDPTPYWLFSTRRPQELKKVLKR